MQIRNEINIQAGEVITDGLSGNSRVQLDTTQYNGTVTYYFEVLGTSSSNDCAVTLRRNGTTTDDATATITGGTATKTLFRSTAFTPQAGQTTYFVQVPGVPGSGIVNAARIIVIQNDTTLTNTETQIEIGNNGTTTSTTLVPVTNPKYWKYDASKWNGTLIAYFESTDAAGNTKSGVTVELQTSTSITAPSWSSVASSSHTNTSLSATRTRSGAITLVDGNWYRVAYSTGTSKSAATIYNAKVIIDQNCNASNTVETTSISTVYGGTAIDFTAVAQSFSLTNATTLSGVTLLLKKTGSPTDTLNIDLVSSRGGSSLANATLSCSSLTTSLALYTFTFGTPYAVSASTTYYIQITRSPDNQDTTNRPEVGRNGSSTYANGTHSDRVTGGSYSDATNDIYFALIGAIGSDTITKLEPQYLLANTLFAAGTSAQNFLTKWDSTEWSGVTNTYTFQAEAADNSTSDVVLIDSGGTTVTGSTLTDVDNAQISSSMTMPSNGNLDTKATTNAGDVAGARILVATVVTASTTAATNEYTTTRRGGGATLVGPSIYSVILFIIKLFK